MRRLVDDAVPQRAGGQAVGRRDECNVGALVLLQQVARELREAADLVVALGQPVEQLRARIETARAQLGLTALPFVSRATIAALREHPALNAWLEDGTFTQHAGVHLGIAVSLAYNYSAPRTAVVSFPFPEPETTIAPWLSVSLA